MPDRQEIISRANDDYDAAIEGCRSQQEQLDADRLAALAAIPSAQQAIGKHDAAIAAAEAAFARTKTNVSTELESGEAKARANSFETQQQAARELQNTDAYTKLHDAQLEAEQNYTDRLKEIDKTTSTMDQRDRERRKAREAREAALAKADRDFRSATDEAQQTYDRKCRTAQDKEIAEVGEVRAKAEAAIQTATREHDESRQAAITGLSAALSAIPAAATIVQAFSDRQRALDDTCAQEKARILAQMKQDLDALG